MPKNDSRVSFTVSNDSHKFLLEWWAGLTGRTTPSLVSFLLERAITEAIRNGEVPKEAIGAMNGFIEAMAEHNADTYQASIANTKAAGSYLDW